ncbi:VOC family protein [Microbacterium luticocti]|uniref:VOC family protein n=1 Tax=Microbacterium luticocti TaxID=451764 RepID=UPI00146A832D|nr:VOC family protein [Microbacterium luticocti]
MAVTDLDAAVEKYSRLFGLNFHVFTPGDDYALEVIEEGEDATPAIPAGGRIAMDTDGCFELVELPDTPEGVRNIHFRVDDVEAAKAHCLAEGLRVVRDLRAGAVREVIFERQDLNGVRVCIAAYEGPSFAEALAGSPRP